MENAPPSVMVPALIASGVGLGLVTISSFFQNSTSITPASNTLQRSTKAFTIPNRPTTDPDAQYYDIIKKFYEDPKQKHFVFPDTLAPKDRFAIHSLSEKFELNHSSQVIGNEKRLVLSKINFVNVAGLKSSEEKIDAIVENQWTQQGLIDRLFYRLQEHEKKFSQIDEHKVKKKLNVRGADNPSPHIILPNQIVGESQAISDIIEKPFIKTEPKTENILRFVNWNIEWMEHFFSNNGEIKLLEHNRNNGIIDVKALSERIGGVIKELNPDILAIEEGPSDIKKMQLFVKLFLEDNFDVFGGLDGQQQRIYVLVKKNGPVKNASVHKDSQNYLVQPWMFDVDSSFELKNYNFTRTPLVVKGEITVSKTVRPIYIMALHTKSKFVASGKSMWNSKNPITKMEYIKKSVSIRRRISSECMRTRKCIDEVIFKEQDDALILVSGDFNDGPGMDFFEEYFLLSDSVDALMGSPFARKKLLLAALLEYSTGENLYTCVFDDYVDEVKSKKVLLDHIFISSSVIPLMKKAGIAHDIYDKYVVKEKQHQRDDRPSDHVPVFADVQLS